jgi:alanyl-tRNA synthetase
MVAFRLAGMYACDDPSMDADTIDEEYEKLQTEFQDVAKTVQSLAEKMQAAEKAGDSNATEWLSDLKQVAQDISDEQSQANTLLQAIHSFVGNAAQIQYGEGDDKTPLYASGHEPEQASKQQQLVSQQPGMFGGGMMGGGMMGGPFGGFLGGGFGRAMMMGGGIGLGESLIGSIFRL